VLTTTEDGMRRDDAPRAMSRAPRARAAVAARAFAALLASTALVGCRAAPARPPAEITVSAASDLTEALPDLAADFQRLTGVRVSINFGSSGQLAQQIAEGAPVDVFMSADIRTMEELGDAGLLVKGTRAIYATGRLVVWTPPAVAPLRALAELASPRIRRVALANPRIAPYGRAAEEALRMAGLWNVVKAKAVFGQNVQSALLYARSGQVDAALVSAAQVTHSPGHALLVPEELYPRLYQAVGVVRDTRNQPAARTFAAYVTGPQGQAILARHGFDPPPEMAQ
jgi:molybdate transport system substrate-binding protein